MMGKEENSFFMDKSTIVNFFKGKGSNNTVIYDSLCKALNSMENWTAEKIDNFILEFVDLGKYLDQRCSAFAINWTIIGRENRIKFVNLLQNIALQHICHTELIIECCIEQFIPRIVITLEAEERTAEQTKHKVISLAVGDDEQNHVYELAHSSLFFILKCYPMAVKHIKNKVAKSYPHFSITTLRYTEYVKNIFCIMDYSPNIRAELWSIIIEHLIQMDAVISKDFESIFFDENVNNSEIDGIFSMGNEGSNRKILQNVQNNERKQKLDICMWYAFAYIAKSRGISIASGSNYFIIALFYG
ncbi:unnamed protein product [Dracunculus medinensis]|uniref:Uncharacterized protein n=1 Tax=Dracunculus medinensis TaxID=318479 RepID=A0A0N4UJP5_DRAME|nr:unnamed protein product [Dracunculus medinensis]